MTGRAAVLASAVLALVVTAAPRAVQADDEDDDERPPTLQKMRFVERGNELTVQTSMTQLFDSEAYSALDSGLLSTVVIQMWIYRKDEPVKSRRPIAYRVLQRQVVYDLWDEVYVIRLRDAVGQRTVKVKYRAEALKLLTSIDLAPIARLKDIPLDTQYVLAMVVQLNPVAKETLAEVRRWLSEGSGGGLDRGGSFFGSFVSVFVNLKLPDADRVLRIVSQPFFRPRKRP